MNPLSKFKKGAIIVHILYHAKKEAIYGAWLKEELRKHGTNSGYLNVNEQIINGKIRKYYSITKKGEKHFQKIKQYLKELYNEVMEEK